MVVDRQMVTLAQLARMDARKRDTPAMAGRGGRDSGGGSGAAGGGVAAGTPRTVERRGEFAHVENRINRSRDDMPVSEGGAGLPRVAGGGGMGRAAGTTANVKVPVGVAAIAPRPLSEGAVNVRNEAAAIAAQRQLERLAECMLRKSTSAAGQADRERASKCRIDMA